MVFQAYLMAGYYFTATDSYDIKWTMPHCVLTLKLIGKHFCSTLFLIRRFPLTLKLSCYLGVLPQKPQCIFLSWCSFTSYHPSTVEESQNSLNGVHSGLPKKQRFPVVQTIQQTLLFFSFPAELFVSTQCFLFSSLGLVIDYYDGRKKVVSESPPPSLFLFTQWLNRQNAFFVIARSPEQFMDCSRMLSLYIF